MKKYTVLVDDNFHYMDEDERYTEGTYLTFGEAVSRCKQIIDDYLASAYKPGMTADKLYDSYTSFGEDPFISPENPDANPRFSAWDYAKSRCTQICKKGETL